MGGRIIGVYFAPLVRGSELIWCKKLKLPCPSPFILVGKTTPWLNPLFSLLHTSLVQLISGKRSHITTGITQFIKFQVGLHTSRDQSPHMPFVFKPLPHAPWVSPQTSPGLVSICTPLPKTTTGWRQTHIFCSGVESTSNDWSRLLLFNIMHLIHSPVCMC